MFFVRTDTNVFEALFTQSVDPIAITAATVAPSSLNPAWHDVLGWSVEELSAARSCTSSTSTTSSMLESRRNSVARERIPFTESFDSPTSQWRMAHTGVQRHVL